jgi:curved DNA-binding protein CbpA
MKLVARSLTLAGLWVCLALNASLAIAETYYDVLGVSPDESGDNIRKAYRQQALQWHPDRHGGSIEAETRLKKINEAYATLSRPDARSTYDTRVGVQGRWLETLEKEWKDYYSWIESTDTDVYQPVDDRGWFERIDDAMVGKTRTGQQAAAAPLENQDATDALKEMLKQHSAQLSNPNFRRDFGKFVDNHLDIFSTGRAIKGSNLAGVLETLDDDLVKTKVLASAVANAPSTQYAEHYLQVADGRASPEVIDAVRGALQKQTNPPCLVGSVKRLFLGY